MASEGWLAIVAGWKNCVILKVNVVFKGSENFKGTDLFKNSTVFNSDELIP